MKKIIIYALVFIFLGNCIHGTEACASSKKSMNLRKSGYEYQALKYELESYRSQAAIQKKKMELTYETYQKMNSRSALEEFKEAELSYNISSFYEVYGTRWQQEQWNKKEGMLQIEVIMYRLSQSEMRYRKAELKEWEQKCTEGAKKKKKGLITELEYKQMQSQEKSARQQWRKLQKTVKKQRKEILSKTKQKKVYFPKESPQKSWKKYWKLWKKNKTKAIQLENEEKAYKKYQEAFSKDIPEYTNGYQYAENKIRLLALEREEYQKELKKQVRDKCQECDTYRKLIKCKSREIQSASEKEKAVKLLWRKGRAVKSQILEQKTEVAKLKYEKESLQYELEKRLVQLEYGIEDE